MAGGGSMARVGRRPAGPREAERGRAGVDATRRTGDEARAVPTGDALRAMVTRGGGGEAGKVEQGRRGWEAFRALARIMRGLAGCEGSARLLTHSKFNNILALTIATVRIKTGAFFGSLPTDTQNDALNVFIYRVQEGEAAFLNDGEPLPIGKEVRYLTAPAAYAAGVSAHDAIQLQNLVAGLVAPDVGVVLEVKTGKGYLIAKVDDNEGGSSIAFQVIEPSSTPYFFDESSLLGLIVTASPEQGVTLFLTDHSDSP